MTGPEPYERAIARVGLPDDWQVIVVIRPRRRSLAVQVQPGGAVTILVPPAVTPEQVTAFVASRTSWIADKVRTAVTLAPDFARKTFTDGESYDLLGRQYRLYRGDGHRVRHPAHADETAPGGSTLHVVAGPPQDIRRDLIALYQREGLAWLVQDGQRYDDRGRAPELRYQVRDLGRRRWGTYRVGPHEITLHWAAFGLPVHLLEYIHVHEQAHAFRPGGRPHGPAWQRQMYRLMTDWKRRHTELAEIGRHAWLGD